MEIYSDKIQEILALVRARYPDWNSFDDPRFVKDESGYKQPVVQKAQEELAQYVLLDLIVQGKFDEFIDRLEKLGQKTNLLWLRAPSTGDLRLLYQENLDRPSFCQAMLELLYGAHPSPQRLERFVEYLSTHNLPAYWTFPTYFLFLCHPESEIFVKPRTASWLFDFMGRGAEWSVAPTSTAYAALLEMSEALRTGLKDYHPGE